MVTSGLIMGLPYHLNELCYPKMTRVLRVRFAIQHKIFNFGKFCQKISFSSNAFPASVLLSHLLHLLTCSDQKFHPTSRLITLFIFPPCTFAHFQTSFLFQFRREKTAKFSWEEKLFDERGKGINSFIKCFREVGKIKDRNSTNACFLGIKKEKKTRD